ncbi:hypothetical protein Trydic_g20055 [Trypoxylus dichotomus]
MALHPLPVTYADIVEDTDERIGEVVPRATRFLLRDAQRNVKVTEACSFDKTGRPESGILFSNYAEDASIRARRKTELERTRGKNGRLQDTQKTVELSDEERTINRTPTKEMDARNVLLTYNKPRDRAKRGPHGARTAKELLKTSEMIDATSTATQRRSVHQ